MKTGSQSRYSVTDANGISILRIEPVRAGRDDAPYECVAENGVGDAVSAEATLTVYEGESFFLYFFVLLFIIQVNFKQEKKIIPLQSLLTKILKKNITNNI